MSGFWETEVRHEGLGKYRHIRGANKDIVVQKALAQKALWEAQWDRQCKIKRNKEQRIREAEKRACDTENRRVERERLQQTADNQKRQQKEEVRRQKEKVEAYKLSRAQEATIATEEAEAAITAMKNILRSTLDVCDEIDWESLKDHSKFNKKPPIQAALPAIVLKDVRPMPKQSDSVYLIGELADPPGLQVIPPAPSRTDVRFRPKLGFFQAITTGWKKKAEMAEAAWKVEYDDWFKAKKSALALNTRLLLEHHQKVTADLAKRFEADLEKWQEDKIQIEKDNEFARIDNAKACDAVKKEYAEAVAKFAEEKELFLSKQKKVNETIDTQKQLYLSGDPGAVGDYCETVLANSTYPDIFSGEWDLDYQAESKLLLIEYQLPRPDQMPTLNEIKYISTKDEMRESHLAEKEINALYDDVLYQIVLRTIHELFEADTACALDAVVFNGLVTSVEKATGNSVTTCVLSVQAGKDEFLTINLANVDPKSCFKSLKGVGSSKLHGITAIPPIAMINRQDRRFVDAYGVVGDLDDSTNLAVMDWEDFEHLIREVFEKEFSETGGEVRVTQASRDGGVDAVAFDPDPIRGGKIVIQAKRYTNTVSVSAVRDLYGTVMNEGATKGILVSTANFGPDAYAFAKGKPLTLLNGGNLLHLLQKHGHRARIDLKEAKMALRVSNNL